MDIPTTKIELIHWLTELQDPKILEQINNIKNSEDWWNRISDAEKSSIDQGLSDLEAGKIHGNDEVMKFVSQKVNE
jgi:predicted transcriptional regulator